MGESWACLRQISLTPSSSNSSSWMFTGVGKAIGAKEDGVAGQKVQRVLIIGDTAEQAGRDACKLEGVAFSATDEERARHASADNAHLCAERIDNGVLNGAVASGNAAKEQPLVEDGENPGRRLARLVNTTEGAHRKSGIQGSGEALAGDVAKVQADGAIGEEEIVQVIAANHRRRLKFVGDGDIESAQGLAGKHNALDSACFLEFLFAQFFNGMKFVRLGKNRHGYVRRGEYTERGVALISA